jgi:hypothetical protein
MKEKLSLIYGIFFARKRCSFFLKYLSGKYLSTGFFLCTIGELLLPDGSKSLVDRRNSPILDRRISLISIIRLFNVGMDAILFLNSGPVLIVNIANDIAVF